MEYAVERSDGDARGIGFRTYVRSYTKASYREIEVMLWDRVLLISIKR
jgi:hypothetical protein